MWSQRKQEVAASDIWRNIWREAWRCVCVCCDARPRRYKWQDVGNSREEVGLTGQQSLASPIVGRGASVKQLLQKPQEKTNCCQLCVNNGCCSSRQGHILTQLSFFLLQMLPPSGRQRRGGWKNDKSPIMAWTEAELSRPQVPPPPLVESAARLRFLALALNSDRKANAQKSDALMRGCCQQGIVTRSRRNSRVKAQQQPWLKEFSTRQYNAGY